jgi:glycine/D-amino acid oxidase-like deaminating enzyme
MTVLPRDVETAVIGGGIVGTCLAWFLAEAGVEVMVLDDGAHSGSSTNAGSLHVQMQSRFISMNPDLVPGMERALPLYMRAVRCWQEVALALDTDIALKQTGGLMVAESAEQYAFLSSKCHRERELGLPVRMLGRKELDGIAPYLGQGVIGAELCEAEGALNPLAANAAIRRQALRSGAMLFSDVRVSGIAAGGGGFELTSALGLVRARRVVIAAGSGSGTLLAQLGLRITTAAEPIHINVTESTTPLITHLVQHAGRRLTLKQTGAGHVIVGGGWPARLAGPGGHPTVELASLIGSLSLGQHVVPAIGGLQLLRSWAGVNVPTEDGLSALGPAADGLFVAIPGDAGYTLGPLSARMVADSMLGREPEMPIDEYSPLRF